MVRGIFYHPFEHSERLDMQEKSVELFVNLLDDVPKVRQGCRKEIEAEREEGHEMRRRKADEERRGETRRDEEGGRSEGREQAE